MLLFGKEPLLAKSKYSVQGFALLLIIFVSYLFTSLFAILLAVPIWGMDVLDFGAQAVRDLSDPSNVNYLKFIQVSGQLGIFVFPSILFAYLVYRKVFSYLKLDVGFKFSHLILSAMIIFFSLPLLSLLAKLNQQMALPEFLSGIENWMKNAEESTARLLAAFLNVKSAGAIIFNFIMIALIPGIAEEFLFRGVLVRFFNRWFANIHWAVFVSSLLFSMFHFQFYGFIPRLALGMLLAYTFVWTASLWVPIILHTINNAFIILVYYRNGLTENNLDSEIESIGSTNNVVVTLIFSLLFIATSYILYQRRKENPFGKA